ncbi:hypothetical protein O6H91_Y346100 [Diphasiastrum complanatum]|nr:hypothetical protein O6H91_Y346100 [Diphasiastrum complanatum]
MGMNALVVFVFGASDVLASFVNGFYYESSDNSLIHWVKKHIFFNVWNSQRVAGLLYVLFGEILFWGIVSGLLHSQRWYWKL